MSRQWLRRCSLVVAEGESGLDLSELHITFKVRQWDLQTPQNAIITVFNLSDDTAQRVQNEFSRVILQAGYEGGDLGVIFDGQIKQVRRGRLNATDTFLEILAADSDVAYNFGMVNKSLAAGATARDQIDAALDGMKEHGVTAGYIPDDLSKAKLPRGKVLFGNARDVLTVQADTANARWSIVNGQYQMVPLTSYIPGDAIVLTSNTGMIGLPQQTIDGITVRALLNPRIKPGRRVQIDNKSVQQAAINPAYSAINYFPKIANDGFYRVLVVDHDGDNRGDTWYSDLVCIALDDSVTPGLAAKGYG